MRRIIVIGSPGAGKSTFARQLRDKTGLPLYYLDMIWHLPDRTTITKEEFDQKLMDILNTDSWIIDGNYGRTIEMRLKSKRKASADIRIVGTICRWKGNPYFSFQRGGK